MDLDGSTSGIRAMGVPVLGKGRDEFQTWRVRMTYKFRGDLSWEIVQGLEERPAALNADEDGVTAAAITQREKERTLWLVKDCRAIEAIGNAIPAELVRRLDDQSHT